MGLKKILILFCLVILNTSCAINQAANDGKNTNLYSVKNLQDFSRYPTKTQGLITRAVALSQQKLSYKMGSSSPKNGGMDCSGTINYLLQTYNQHNVPRQSEQLYRWVKRNGTFHAVKKKKATIEDLTQLKPGDLLFWTGTYPVKPRSRVTHVMLYLGKNKQNIPIMFGAANNRPNQRGGVNIYHFTLKKSRPKERFIGYGCIPNVSCSRS